MQISQHVKETQIIQVCVALSSSASDNEVTYTENRRNDEAG